MSLPLLFAITVFGSATALIYGRITLLVVRGGWLDEMQNESSAFSNIFATIGFPAQISLIIFGFLYFAWWLWLIVFVIMLFTIPLVVTRSNFPMFYTIRSFLSVVTVVCAVIARLNAA